MSAAEQMADEMYGLHCDIGRLERENANLRVERDEWHRVAESKQDIIDHMRDDHAENAELCREIVFKRQQIEVLCEAVRWLMGSNEKISHEKPR